ncbi:MAG: hypothetical protein LQ350_008185 [Teloschistes chrysophthalmus]|nr:MAG: hypothetical protein LQ350_008185 [Niorma chrysophthalma]
MDPWPIPRRRAVRNMMPPHAPTVNHEIALAQAVNDLARQPRHPLNDAILYSGVDPDNAWAMVKAEQSRSHLLGFPSQWDRMLEGLEAQIHMQEPIEEDDGRFQGFDVLHRGQGAGFPRPPHEFAWVHDRGRPRALAFNGQFRRDGHHGLNHPEGLVFGQGHPRAERERAPSRSGEESASDLARRQQRAREERRSDAQRRTSRRLEERRHMDNMGHTGMGGFR